MDEWNWARNYRYTATRLLMPQRVEELQEIVAAGSQLKVLGTRHSFNAVADTDGELIAMQHFDKIVDLDHANRTVTVEAGIKYGTLCQWLDGEGYALHNLASLPHISVAGACATATHGSGNQNANLATAVVAMEMVTDNGDVRNFSCENNGEQFEGMVVGLGGLGVVTKLTLEIQPRFAMRQYVYQNLPLATLENHFDAITGEAYSVSLFTDWREPRFNQVWIKERTEGGTLLPIEPEFFGAMLARSPLHPLETLSAENCTEQMGVPGAWYERLPHFRMNFTPSSGEELQSEYLVPRPNAITALNAVYELHTQIAPLLQISEIRTIAADTLWMSPCYQQDCVGIHFTWKKDWGAVKELLPLIESHLAPFDARPHWGKLFTMEPAQFQPLYPKLPSFRQMLQSFDPTGKFRNAFLEKNIYR